MKALEKLILLSALWPPYPLFKNYTHCHFVHRKKKKKSFCVSLFQKGKKKVQKQFTSCQLWAWEKTYKASVEVGSELFHKISCFFCVCVFQCFFLFFLLTPLMCIELLCHLWSHLRQCGVFAVLTNKECSSESSRALGGPMAHTVSHKAGSRITVCWSTKVKEWGPLGSFDWPGVSFSCSCVNQKGRLLSGIKLCLKQEVAHWTFCLQFAHWNPTARLNTLVPVDLQDIKYYTFQLTYCSLGLPNTIGSIFIF